MGGGAQWAKIKVHSTLIKKIYENWLIDQTVILGPFIKPKRLNIDQNIPEILSFSPFVHFIKDFQEKTFRDFLFSNRCNLVNIWAIKVFFLTGQNFARNWLVMLSVSVARNRQKLSNE